MSKINRLATNMSHVRSSHWSMSVDNASKRSDSSNRNATKPGASLANVPAEIPSLNAFKVRRVLARRPRCRAVHGTVFNVRSDGVLWERPGTAHAFLAVAIRCDQQRRRSSECPLYFHRRPHQAHAVARCCRGANEHIFRVSALYGVRCFVCQHQGARRPRDGSSTLISTPPQIEAAVTGVEPDCEFCSRGIRHSSSIDSLSHDWGPVPAGHC